MANRALMKSSLKEGRPARSCAVLAKMIAPAMLHAAWKRVRANHGGPGGDGVTIAAFSARLDRELAALAMEIGTNKYRPGPLRRVGIPKPAGGVRMLAIPCVRDRVAQSAALSVLQPALEGRQSMASFAYRPARGVDHAIAAVRHAHNSGLVWTLEADITACFDSIPHRRLIAELAIWLESEPMLRLLALWVHGFSPTGNGVAQGAPIAPLLANLYLHPLDRLLAAAGYVPVRYADDFGSTRREHGSRPWSLAADEIGATGARPATASGQNADDTARLAVSLSRSDVVCRRATNCPLICRCNGPRLICQPHSFGA